MWPFPINYNLTISIFMAPIRRPAAPTVGNPDLDWLTEEECEMYPTPFSVVTGSVKNATNCGNQYVSLYWSRQECPYRNLGQKILQYV